MTLYRWRPVFGSIIRASRYQKHEPRALSRAITTQTNDLQSKYAQKLQRKAEETGVSLEELVEKAKAEKQLMRKREGEKLKATFQPPKPEAEGTFSTPSASTPLSSAKQVRKDATPFKSLTSILNLPRLLSTPHTAEQISALWTAYHASRSGGTGRGYICASIPLSLYTEMEKIAKPYPTFVVPVPRIQPPTTEGKESKVAHEFYFLQWDFHGPPPKVSLSDDPFVAAKESMESSENPPVATLLFTPLQEYKLRNSFATPYLVLTMYTDLASSHGIVLLRGEITPGSGASGDRYMLGQEDAQQLTLALQKFYLWSDKKESDQIPQGQRLLRMFHENPKEFDWQELLKFAGSTI